MPLLDNVVKHPVTLNQIFGETMAFLLNPFYGPNFAKTGNIFCTKKRLSFRPILGEKLVKIGPTQSLNFY
jgi:hypothetical protein